MSPAAVPSENVELVKTFFPDGSLDLIALTEILNEREPSEG